MPQLNDGCILEFTDIQTWNNVRPIYNVYWWYSSIPLDTGDLAAIATDWNANYRDDIRAIQTASVIHTQTKLVTYEPDAAGVAGLFTQGNVAGTKAGEANAIFNSFGVKYFGSTRETRPGFKRIAGVAESDAAGGDLIAGAITAVGAAMSFYAADWQVTGVPTLTPVIVKRTITINGVKVNLTPENWIYNPVSSYGVSTRVRSQVSRQFNF